MLALGGQIAGCYKINDGIYFICAVGSSLREDFFSNIFSFAINTVCCNDLKKYRPLEIKRYSNLA
jgi:hypothetical protein